MDITTYLNKNHLPLRIIMIVIFIFLIPCFASAYSVEYDYWVRALKGYYPENVAISDSSSLEGVSSTSGFIEQTGTGNSATIQYYADLATGAIGAYAYAESDRLYASGKVDKIGFSDTLTFLVPAGYYAEDLTVTLSGAITGTLSATKIAEALANYWITFGGSVLTPGLQGIGVNETGTMVIDDPIALTRTLVSGGTNLAEDKYVSYDLTASLNSILASTKTQYSDPVYAEATVDFNNTLQFTYVAVPEGVTWTSESGVFLSQTSPPTTAPEPATLLLVGFGLLGIAGLRRKF
jgi:hypothetical protein